MNPERWIFNSLLPFIFFKFCTSIDTITPNQYIKDGGDLLVSNGYNFALGFFSPGNSSPHKYVGIWLNKISKKTVVWVANRDNPINGTSGVLYINTDGNLVVYDSTQNLTLWQTNVSASAEMGTNNSYSSQLLDSGNLVLFHGDNVVWQSFDQPSNIWLPNMKIGLDRRTGLDRVLTSWKTKDDPGTGEYVFKMDPEGTPQAVLHKGSVRLWRTGPWVGNRWSGIPEMTVPKFKLNPIYVDNNDELYMMYGPTDATIVFLDESGYLHRAMWANGKWIEFWSAPMDRCDHYDRCGPNGFCDQSKMGALECPCLPGYEPKSGSDQYVRDRSTGCMRKRMALSMCGNGEGFVNVAGVKIPDTSQARSQKNLSMEACRQECLSNCSCFAYMNEEDQCITWYGNLTDTIKYINGGLDLYIRVDAIELAQQSKKSKRFHGKKVAIVLTSAVAMLLLIISLACWLVIKRRRETKPNIQGSNEENLELPMFDMVTIFQATNRFSITNKIGEGGFGTVYKGQLLSGKEIAVKRLSMNSKQGLNEFKNEVILIAKLQHRNLVRLLGCCIHGEERILVYEYMANGSLDSFIFGVENAKKKLLTWKRRLDIVEGIARGLLYLHRDSRLRVIHRDLKASNVLLDSNMNPKISDFGLARDIGGDQSSAITRRVVGTYGYMSPEYAIDGLFSMKSDIFGFGVIVLELLSGKRNRLFQHQDHDFNLLGHAWKLWVEGKASELFDPLMESSVPLSAILRCLQIGLLCVQKRPEDRPTMSSVLLMLTTETIVLPQPQQPGFFTERNCEEKYYLQDQSIYTVNEVTVTQIEAR